MRFIRHTRCPACIMAKRILMSLLLLLCTSDSQNMDSDKEEFCREVEQCETDQIEVCGIRGEGEKFRLKIFSSECELLKYGCKVEEKDAYGIINMRYCKDELVKNKGTGSKVKPKIHDCITECPAQVNNETICGIRRHGDGFKVRLFVNQCEMLKYNCEHNFTFDETDHFICNGLILPNDSKKVTESIQSNETDFTEVDNVLLGSKNFTITARGGTDPKSGPKERVTETTNQKLEFFGDGGVPTRKRKNLVVVDTSVFDNSGDLNETIENFFAGTHVFDLPLKDVTSSLPADTRKRMVHVFGPVVVFKPSFNIPKNVSEDVWHSPTLQSCFHACPTKCPDTYAPVCGVPGMVAREPSLMFKNHCLMDAVQCKMRWDNASLTAQSSAYIETSFVFCVSDSLNGLYRFLPLIRTLQHMGRLKKKGRFRTRLRNMRFFNELLRESPKLMG